MASMPITRECSPTDAAAAADDIDADSDGSVGGSVMLSSTAARAAMIVNFRNSREALRRRIISGVLENVSGGRHRWNDADAIDLRMQL